MHVHAKLKLLWRFTYDLGNEVTKSFSCIPSAIIMISVYIVEICILYTTVKFTTVFQCLNVKNLTLRAYIKLIWTVWEFPFVLLMRNGQSSRLTIRMFHLAEWLNRSHEEMQTNNRHAPHPCSPSDGMPSSLSSASRTLIGLSIPAVYSYIREGGRIPHSSYQT